MLRKLHPPTADASRFSTREKVILLNGSKLHGCKFWPWEKDPLPSSFQGDLYTDTCDFQFSADQLRLLDGWERASKLANGEPNDVCRGSVDLVQDVASDCSVVASLCALTARTDMLGSNSSLIPMIVHPSDRYPANGKFTLRFNFNGCARRVEIDDQLPMSKGARCLHVFDRADRSTLWPALIEKAYMKVRGGYDFPGSNSGTDLWVLTGWIPEQVFLHSEALVPNAFWKRILAAFEYGDVLVTLGTAKLGSREEQALGLVSEHAYAIIGMKEEGSRRLLHIKNPWSQAGPRIGWTLSSPSPEATAQERTGNAGQPGTFWMDLNTVVNNFATVYLNWNPGLFSHRYDVHFTWDMAVRSAPESFSRNPQYTLHSRKGGSVWLLLSKHFENFSRAKLDSDDTDPRLQTGFLSLYAFEQEYRVSLASGPILRSPFVDSPNILLRFEMPADTKYVIVPSEQDMPSGPHTFTLSAFSTTPLTQFTPAKERYSHTVSRTGSWTLMTSGGSTSSSTYHSNPQYRLQVSETTELAMLLETSNAELAVQLKLVWASGKRIPHTLTTRDVCGDSGAYRRGSALATIPDVLAGTYTVVVSTFEPGQLSDFTLHVRSSHPCTLSPISLAEPGVFTSILPRATFPYSVDRLLAPLFVQRLTRIHALAQSLPAIGITRPSPIKLTLEFGQGASRLALSSSDQFVDRIARLPEKDLRPDMCMEGSPGLWLVVERLAAAAEAEESVQVEVFGTEQGVRVGEWGMASQMPIEAFEKNLRISR